MHVYSRYTELFFFQGTVMKLIPCGMNLYTLTLFLQNFKHRLSLEILNNSMERFSYGANPATSRIRSLTNFARLLGTYNDKMLST